MKNLKKTPQLTALAQYLCDRNIGEEARKIASLPIVQQWLANLTENVYQDDAVLDFEETCAIMLILIVMKKEDCAEDVFVVYEIKDGKAEIFSTEELDGISLSRKDEPTFEFLGDEDRDDVLGKIGAQGFALDDYIDQLIEEVRGNPASAR